MFSFAAKALTNSFSYYSGIFSTAVTASVNPTATLAALSILGAIENAATYDPDSVFFNALADKLNAVPVLSAARDLPLANPYAAVFLTLIAAVMIVLHSFSKSKLFSSATIDRIDKLVGWIGISAMSLLPLLTNEQINAKESVAVKAAEMASSAGTVAKSTPWYAWVIGIITLLVATVIYSCVYDCFDNIGVICAAVPVKGLNIIEQVFKGFLHAGLVLLQITYPTLSLVISIIFSVLGLFLFRILARLTFYYKEVYARPLLHNIFRKNKPVELVHKKLPRRIRKLYPEAGLAIPLFVISGIKKIPSRGVIWLILDKGQMHLCAKRFFFRVRHFDFDTFPERTLEKGSRFMRLSSPDKKFNIVISNIYKASEETLRDTLCSYEG